MESYRLGDIVELVESSRARTRLIPGMRGTIERIDPNGVLWVDWTNGPIMPMIPCFDVVASTKTTHFDWSASRECRDVDAAAWHPSLIRDGRAFVGLRGVGVDAPLTHEYAPRRDTTTAVPAASHATPSQPTATRSSIEPKHPNGPAPRLRRQLEWSYTQAAILVAGTAIAAFSGLALARAGTEVIESAAVPMVRAGLWQFTPATAAIALMFGLAMIATGARRSTVRSAYRGMGAIALVFGAVLLAQPDSFGAALEAGRNVGWLCTALGSALLGVGLGLPATQIEWLRAGLKPPRLRGRHAGADEPDPSNIATATVLGPGMAL